MAICDAEAARWLDSGAVRAAGAYDTLFRSDPTRPKALTAGLKAAQLAAAHARTSALTKAMVAKPGCHVVSFNNNLTTSSPVPFTPPR
mmetsp:Transcript_15407/g.22563  ORF Transcript_15407/g.22563 Transcript_15407/m.22563 type:complete len:88 (+) Transcript_15407:1054-1317(+)